MAVGERWRNRTFYRTLDAGLDAMRIHDTSARKVVRDFCVELVTDPRYRDAFHVSEAWVGDEPTFDDVLQSPIAPLRLWTTPSMSYLGIGGWLLTAIDDPLDGFELVGQVYGTRLVVNTVWRPGADLIHGRTVVFPTLSPRRRVGGPRTAVPSVRVCPTCHEALPAAGRCDNCE